MKQLLLSLAELSTGFKSLEERLSHLVEKVYNLPRPPSLSYRRRSIYACKFQLYGGAPVDVPPGAGRDIPGGAVKGLPGV